MGVSKESVLEISRLGKRFGHTQVLEDLDLQIAEGEFIVLLGPSGCGKTTTLRMIAGFEEPSSGSIRHHGQTISQKGQVVPPEKRGMGMVFQSYAIWPHMTVFQNVAYGLKLRRIPKLKLKESVTNALRIVQMSDYGDRYPGELSGGQQQRVAFARALAIDPTVLLMDEPLSNLDAKLRDDMRFELRQLHNQLGFTAVYVTHDQSEAMALADRIVVLKDGVVQQVGTPQELYQTPATDFVAQFIGRAQTHNGIVTSDKSIEFAGTTIPASSVIAFPAGAKPGDTVRLVLRPQNLRLTEAGASGTVAAKVGDVIFLGESTSCVIHIPALNSEITVEVSPFTPLKTGDEVGLIFENLSVVSDTQCTTSAHSSDPSSNSNGLAHV